MAWLTVLGIPAALYVASMTALMFYLVGKTQDPLVLLGAAFVTTGIYMFHRTSIVVVDPLQTRHRLAIEYKHTLRVVSWSMLVLSVAILSMRYPFSVLLVTGSVVGVVVYGRKTITKPIRNVTNFKPFAVGIAIGVFAWTLNGFSNSIFTFLAVVLICSADALLCDLEDCSYDLASGCTTLASKYGNCGTWIIAGLLYVLAAICFQSIIGLLFLLLFFIPLLLQKSIRTVVDVRPLLILLLAWTL